MSPFLIFVSACGDAMHSTSETGAIVFTVEWQGAPTIQTSQAATSRIVREGKEAEYSALDLKKFLQKDLIIR